MNSYLQRLLRTSAAYQASDILAKLIAVGTLPVYTRYLSSSDYGAAETLLTGLIMVSIFVRLGLGEAFVRLHFDDADAERQAHLARLSTGFVLATSSLVAGAGALAAGPLSRVLLGFQDPVLMRIALLGLWAFTNLEIAYALLRVQERARAYLTASIVNVLVTVALTVTLVVLAHERARGLLAGNFLASTLVLAGLWVLLRDRLGVWVLARDRPSWRRWRAAPLAALLSFGLPTVPADASVYALNVIDRAYLYRAHSHASAGLYAVAVKLATVVTLVVRGFQYAWPPLAYSVTDDAEAARLYAAVATYYCLATGFAVAAVTLLGRWALRLLAAPSYYGAHAALPWLALGWALYGLFVVLVVVAGRARVTTRNFAAALVGLIVNVALLVLLVDPAGIAGAGIALCGAYVVMLATMHLLTRRLFPVSFQWGRLAHVVLLVGGVAVAGELVLPASGAAGLASRVAALAAIPVLVLVTGFLSSGEREGLRRLLALARSPRRRDSPPASPG